MTSIIIDTCSRVYSVHVMNFSFLKEGNSSVSLPTLSSEPCSAGLDTDYDPRTNPVHSHSLARKLASGPDFRSIEYQDPRHSC
jgi:hypothetical protein